MTEPRRKRLPDAIAERIIADIEAGEFGSPGGKLPTSKILAERYGVSTRTIDSAMEELIDDGDVIGRQGGRRYIAGAPPEDATGDSGQSQEDDDQE